MPAPEIDPDGLADPLTTRLAGRLRALRQAAGWSLDSLALRSGVPRTTLSRLETGATSPTAQHLGRLCAAHGLSVSRLMAMVEDDFRPLIPAANRARWTDPATGYVRQAVSPPADPLQGEVIEGHLPPGARIAYDRPPVPGQEHHLVLLDGALRLALDGVAHDLRPGDCLRYRLHGPSEFATGPDRPARYLLFLI